MKFKINLKPRLHNLDVLRVTFLKPGPVHILCVAEVCGLLAWLIDAVRIKTFTYVSRAKYERNVTKA